MLTNDAAVNTEANYSAGSDSDPGPGRVSGQVPADCAGMRVDRALARMFPEHSRSRLARWLRAGEIRVAGRSPEPDQKVWGGETVELRLRADARAAPPAAECIALEVIHEDDWVLVVNKPAGLVVHPGSGNWSGTMLNALLHHAACLAAVPRAGIVHRLDKDTSGLLVVAKTLAAQTSLVRQLQARSVLRGYLALAYGRVASDGSIEAPIGRDPRVRTRMGVLASGKPALTRYRVLRRFEGATLLECRLATGRTHQIRVHLHSIGHPLVGDPVYRTAHSAASRADLGRMIRRQCLHAARLAFEHPQSGERCGFEAPVPQDMRSLLDSLRAAPGPTPPDAQEAAWI
ncbi:MAG: RluA family pseudouridine synthase [Burkholderiales bacterium]|nr:RluA family pseudouridine synthase [Burkholderiales bacterium]